MVRRAPETPPVQVLIGVARDLAEPAIRQAFAAKLRLSA
jgi:hypothetical protein